jgi:DNA transposition AAA+ family ATPase
VKSSLRDRIDELASEARRDGYEQAIVDEAEMLRARAAER